MESEYEKRFQFKTPRPNSNSCFILLRCLSPFSEVFVLSHWSQGILVNMKRGFSLRRRDSTRSLAAVQEVRRPQSFHFLLHDPKLLSHLPMMMMIMTRRVQSRSCWRAPQEIWAALSTSDDLSVDG